MKNNTSLNGLIQKYAANEVQQILANIISSGGKNHGSHASESNSFIESTKLFDEVVHMDRFEDDCTSSQIDSARISYSNLDDLTSRMNKVPMNTFWRTQRIQRKKQKEKDLRKAIKRSPLGSKSLETTLFDGNWFIRTENGTRSSLGRPRSGSTSKDWLISPVLTPIQHDDTIFHTQVSPLEQCQDMPTPLTFTL